jgi:hypothetical protein
MHLGRMGWSAIVLLSCLAGGAVVGCSSGEDGAGPGGGDTLTDNPAGLQYYRDVKPIIDAKCNSCHAEGGIGPFALVTYENVSSLAGVIKDQVASKTMPPWPPNASCNDYSGDRSLSDAQIDTIVKWVDEGAPEGDPKLEGAPLSVEKTQLSRVDLNLSMAEEYTQNTVPDDYRCFVLDWPYQDVKYVSGFRANPGNARVVHHVIAFLITPGDVPTLESLDAAEAGPGYTCFGSSGVGASEWIGAWAPGSEGSDLPPGTGIRVDPGSKIALQVHYNNTTGQDQPDQTSVDFKIDDAVEKEGRIQPWTKLSWLSGQNMLIPAGDTDVMHSFEFDPTQYISGGNAFTMHSASLHMHQLGTSARLAIHRAGGADECLLQIDDWNFHWQGAYGLAAPTVFNPGDMLYLECHWDNSAGNQTGAPKDTWWGEGTGDEMCLGSFYLTQ